LSKSSLRSQLRPVILVLATTAAVAALAVTASASVGSARQSTAAPKPLPAKAWRALIGKAQQEGSVTLYSVQAPANLAALAKAFEAKFKIKVTVNRNVDNVIVAQLNAERSTGKYEADLWVPSLKRYVLGATRNGWIADAVGPNFFKKRYNRKEHIVGKGWHTGSAILGIAWNTKAAPNGVTDHKGFLAPNFSGRIGVPDPRVSTSFMDWYLWANAKYGKSFESQLAAQKPKIYTSSLPMTQAVASGEIIGAVTAAGTALQLKDAGAPIEYKVLPDNWNAPYIGVVMKTAPHPNAAQLLANYMLSPEGQALANLGFGALYPNIPGTFYAKVRNINVNDFSPAKVKAFNDEWVNLFTK
jgi:iron(III) transport system substrate-binding protein